MTLLPSIGVGVVSGVSYCGAAGKALTQVSQGANALKRNFSLPDRLFEDLMLKKAFCSAAMALTLAACQSTGEPAQQKLATITPAQMDGIVQRMAAHVEGDPENGAIFASELLNAEISDPFWRPALLNNDPHTSFCVTVSTGFEALPQRIFYIFDVYDAPETTPEKRKVQIERSKGFSLFHCNGKAMKRFEAVFTLRAKRRAAHAAHRPAEKPMP